MIEVKHGEGYVKACRTDGAWLVCYPAQYVDHGGDPQAAERAAIAGLGQMGDRA